MRLVCPNCDAKYEVPDDAIPDTGRDVQCTNCGHSWFQMRGRTAAVPTPVAVTPEPVEAAAPPEAAPEPVVETKPAAAETLIEAAPEPAAPEPQEEPPAVAAVPEALVPEAVAAPETVVDAVVGAIVGAAADIGPVEDPAHIADSASDIGVAVSEAAAAVETATADIPVTEPALVAADAADAAHAVDPDLSTQPDPAVAAGAEAEDDQPASTVPDYAVDDSVLAILREEAEREANARRAEALESQTDLGIEAAIPAKVAAVVEAEAKPAARRDLLPDVEEINSTLRPSEKQAEADGTPDFVSLPPEAPRGFRSGFLSLMTIAILGAALYLVAPRLGVMVPALSGPLEAYVSMIDSLRLGLDGMMRSATVAISG
jgi:predicted Zn finger-like uncharacterized protein